ncbi:MAG: hypothetical protein Alpg2KO_26610 [Alphaproteobacteria bacterium]
MKARDLTKMTLAAALFGAVATAGVSIPTDAEAQGKVKCYGIAKAGQNGCANAAGTHSCAGQATVDYDGGEWKLADTATCTEMGGSTTPFEGVNAKLAGESQ